METVDHSQPPLSPILLDELVIEILSWLPVKSLLQFRCVSKSWKSLISDPKFVKLHLHRAPKNSNLILTSDISPIEYYGETDFCFCAIPCSKQSLLENGSSLLENGSSIDVRDACFRLKDTYWCLGSCNGLVCFRKRHFVDDEVIGFQVRFWNPALRLRSKKSPSLHLNWSDYEYGPARYGFGYDNSSDTYKVAVISLGSENTVVEVLSMGDNRWRKILSFPAFPFLCQLYGKFLSGTLNWLALNKSGYRYDWGTVTVNQLVIFSLDLEKETYKQMSLPTGLDEVPSVEPKLGYLWDCLCLVLYYRGSHFVIWQMKEFGVENSWTQLISISYQHLQIVNDEYHALLPLFTAENGDALVLVNNADFEAIIYYWKDKRVERIEIPNLQLWIDAKEHIPSMVLPC